MNVEIVVEKFGVSLNGNFRGGDHRPEDLVLLAEWIAPNYDSLSVAGMVQLKDVEAGHPMNLAATSQGFEDDIKRRLFKTNYASTSLIKLSVVRRKKLGKVAKLIGGGLEQVFTAAIGAATSGIGATVSGFLVGELFKFKDKWEDVLGEAVIEVRDQLPENMDVEFSVTESVEKAIRKLYTHDVTEGGSVVATPMLPTSVIDFLAQDHPKNGAVRLKIIHT